MDIPEYLVIVGASCDEDVYTDGTGFLVSKGSKTYVVTCRHVVFSHNDINFRFAIPKPKKTKNLKWTLILSEPFFHIDDTNISNSDICVLEILNKNTESLHLEGFKTINFDNLLKSTMPINGGDISVFGFPIDRIEPLLEENKPDELLPCTTLLANIIDIEIPKSSLSGFNGEYKSEIGIPAFTNDEPIGRGASGGPIIEKDKNCPCGVIIASGYLYIEGKKQNVILFTPISFVVDILKRL